jgi:hypothetical protein
MAGPESFIIPGAISLISSLIGGTRDAGEFDVGDINALINSYRRSGMAGIERLGVRERERATHRLAASGMEPNLGLQQSLFNPILEKLGIARSDLEGKLAQMRSQMMLAQAQGQQRSDLAEFGNLTDLFSGISDLSGLFALRGLENLDGSGGDNQSYIKPFDLWNQQYLQQ